MFYAHHDKIGKWAEEAFDYSHNTQPCRLCCLLAVLTSKKKKKTRFHQNVVLLDSGQLVNFYPPGRVTNLAILYVLPEMVC